MCEPGGTDRLRDRLPCLGPAEIVSEGAQLLKIAPHGRGLNAEILRRVLAFTAEADLDRAASDRAPNDFLEFGLEQAIWFMRPDCDL